MPISYDELVRRVALLERRLANVPIWVPPQPPDRLHRLRITGGGDLGYGGLFGVKYTSTEINSVSAMDPDTPGHGADDGVGWATDMHTGDKCLVVTGKVVIDSQYIGGGVLSFDLPEDTEVLAWKKIRIPKTGDPTTVQAFYEIWYLG